MSKQTNQFKSIIGPAILVAVYGVRAFSTDYYVDSEILNTKEYLYNWDSIGRFGLIWIKKLTGLDWINPYLEAVLFLAALCLLFFLTGRLFAEISRFSARAAGNTVDAETGNSCTEGILPGLCALIALIFPTYGEQFLFRFQSFEIALAMIFCVGAVLLLLDFGRTGRICPLIASVPLLMLSFGIYQSMVPLAICLYGAVCLFISKKVPVKELLRTALGAVIQFVCGFGLYELIAKLFYTDGDYLAGKMAWKAEGFSACFQYVKDYVKDVLFAHSLFYPVSFTIALVVFAAAFVTGTVFSIRHLRKDGIKESLVGLIASFVGAAVVVSAPFMLTVVLGSAQDFRAQLVLPFSIAVMWLFAMNVFTGLFDKETKESTDGKAENIPLIVTRIIATAGAVIFLVIQAAPLERLFYTESVVADGDRIVAENLVTEISKHDTSKPVVIIGSLPARTNASCYTTADALTYQVISVYSLDIDPEPRYFYSSNRILGYFKTIGYEFTAPERDNMAEAYEVSNDMPSYPKDGCVLETDDIIVVKLNN